MPTDPTVPPDLDDSRRRRALFRATHRGTWETDRLIGDYVRDHIATMPDAALAALEIVLTLQDPDLADFLTGGTTALPVPDGDAEPYGPAGEALLASMRAYVAARSAPGPEAVP